MNAKDLIAVLEYTKAFQKDKTPKRWRKEKEPDDFLKQILKFQKTKEEYDKWLKGQEKKEEKKHKGLLPDDWSLAKKTTFFALFGPPLGIGYVFGLVIMVRGLSAFILGVH